MPVTAPLRHPLAARRTQRCFHFLLQNYLDNFPHALSNRSLQPLSQRTLLAHLHCSASLRHGVFLLCPEPLARRFRAFSFNDFSGEYAFYFSTGIGTEPRRSRRLKSSPNSWGGNGLKRPRSRPRESDYPTTDSSTLTTTDRDSPTLASHVLESNPGAAGGKFFVFSEAFVDFRSKLGRERLRGGFAKKVNAKPDIT